jgi:hypothetical protein
VATVFDPLLEMEFLTVGVVPLLKPLPYPRQLLPSQRMKLHQVQIVQSLLIEIKGVSNVKVLDILLLIVQIAK